MPKRNDIKKIMVLGSGPIVIGQGAEFDYAGVQACLSLKEEGYQVILLNSNPATIMTDPDIAHRVYMEPLTPEFAARVIRLEKPDALLPGLGGQTGLNLAMELANSGLLAECGVELLGADPECIARAEDRELFKELCQSLNEPVLPSHTATTLEEGLGAAEAIGYPVVVRPAFTLGGSGGGFAGNERELRPLLTGGLELSPVRQVLVEKSIKGFKEIEYEVMRDANDTALVICNMENIDPVGVHTGDSMVVAPSQTLTNKEYQLLRNSALKLIRSLKLCGGCNVQFALDPESFAYYVIEVNPRVSRSSALASKASGYPIARVAAKLAVGLTLDEISLANTPASFEPALDYVVIKMARFPFDKFATAENLLSTQMKATGEVMSVGRTLEEGLLKAVRSLETGRCHICLEKFDRMGSEDLLTYVAESRDDRVYAIAQLLRNGAQPRLIQEATRIDLLFINKIGNIVAMEQELAAHVRDAAALRAAKRLGFSDRYTGQLWGMTEQELRAFRKAAGILPVYKMIDSCASEFESYIPYFYSTYEEENEARPLDGPKIIVLGAGPIRIGQGVEFDYSTVHALRTLKGQGYQAIVINNNPETVSTDYSIGDKLYFEPLTVESVLDVVDQEQPLGVIVTLGGQTAVNLAGPLQAQGVPILGTDSLAIEAAENRDAFEQVLRKLQIPQPPGRAVLSVRDGAAAAGRVGYPVLVRPSYVLGGRAMEIVADENGLKHYLETALALDPTRPVLVDKYLSGRELEVDAVSDGENVFCPGVMELVERTGVHSGDSISVFPDFTISAGVRRTILDYTRRLGLALNLKGLYNIQFIADKQEQVYVIEVNPRSSRSVPFLSKASGYALADIATLVMLGISLKEQGLTGVPGRPARWYVKAPAFSFAKLRGLDAYLSPEMKSTGEAIGYDSWLTHAFYKALLSAGMRLTAKGSVLISVPDEAKPEILPLAQRFRGQGFSILATAGTAAFLESHGIPATVLSKVSQGSDAIPAALREGRVSYVLSMHDIRSRQAKSDGYIIRRAAVENNVAMFTSPDTARVLLDVLEEMIPSVSPLT